MQKELEKKHKKELERRKKQKRRYAHVTQH